ncbi:MAG: phosphoribosylanthranilate isomerase, partial [Paracoccaceae bacterium]
MTQNAPLTEKVDVSAAIELALNQKDANRLAELISDLSLSEA